MEEVVMWETKDVLVLLAIIAVVFILALLLTGEDFSSKVSEVIRTMLQ